MSSPASYEARKFEARLRRENPPDTVAFEAGLEVLTLSKDIHGKLVPAFGLGVVHVWCGEWINDIWL